MMKKIVAKKGRINFISKLVGQFNLIDWEILIERKKQEINFN